MLLGLALSARAMLPLFTSCARDWMKCWMRAVSASLIAGFMPAAFSASNSAGETSAWISIFFWSTYGWSSSLVAKASWLSWPYGTTIDSTAPVSSSWTSAVYAGIAMLAIASATAVETL